MMNINIQYGLQLFTTRIMGKSSESKNKDIFFTGKRETQEAQIKRAICSVYVVRQTKIEE
jgi:hypothetical protein